MTSLSGKVAIVTGSTKGIGRVIATTLADRGAKVILAGRSVQRGEDAAAQIRDAGGEAIFVPTDVGIEADAAKAVATAVEAYGTLTTLVNNAASTDLLARSDDEVAKVELDGWDQVLRTTLTGTMLMSKHALPVLLAGGGGSIINISSDSSVRAPRGFAAYGAAKAGVNSLTRSIAVEYGDQGIRANTIVLGLVLPPHAVSLFEGDPALDAKLRAGRASPRLGRREDVAGVVAFYASDDAEYLNGTMLPVDGGASIMSNILGKAEIFEGRADA